MASRAERWKKVRPRARIENLVQNIALFLHSSTMMVAPCLHLKFWTKVGIRYWEENEEFGHLLKVMIFFLITILLGQKTLHTKKWPHLFLNSFPFRKAITAPILTSSTLSEKLGG